MDINEFIKQKYPKVEFVPLNFEKKKTNSIAFVISDNKFVIGYISKDGTLCKLINPLDLNTVDNSVVIDVIEKIPTALYFNQKDKDNVIKLLKCSAVQKTNEEALKDLKESYQKNFDMLIKTKDEEKIESVLLVKKEYSDKLTVITDDFNARLQKCETTLLDNKKQLEEELQKYKEQMNNYIKNSVSSQPNDQLVVTLNNTIETLTMEKGLLEKQLDSLKSNVQNETSKEIISSLQQELDSIKKEFTGQSLKDKVSLEFYKKCIDKILNEKLQIIDKIKLYNKNWLEWTKTNCTSNDIYIYEKEQLKEDMQKIKELMSETIKKKDAYIDSLLVSDKEKDTIITTLKKNIDDIKIELNKTFVNQISALVSQNNELKKLLEEKNKRIMELLSQLESIKKNLDENSKIPSDIQVDYNDCKDTFNKFVTINNTFYRKLDIIKSLRDIINGKNTTAFSNLDPRLQKSIKSKFLTISTDIEKLISKMNLQKYTNSPLIYLFKNENTIKDIPIEFCKELFDISVFWNNNADNFKKQDTLLSNLYEDLSGAVRIYIRVKPYIKQGVVSIDTTKDNYNGKITIDCKNVPGVNRIETYTDFYDTYSDKFNTKEVYSGINSEENNSIFDLKINNFSNRSIHNSFKQVTDGYSVVLSGYGLSGSGKTHTLLGTNGIPGLLHYGISNLENVKTVKLKYLFEQYINSFSPTLNMIRGSIINLINKFPNLKSPYMKDERLEFKEYLSNQIDLSNITVNMISKLVNLIDAYRKAKKRVKKTPNNPESSRSHLFLVFEIEFNDNKLGYITILDCAGRESPIDLFNTYIDTTKRVSLVTLLGPSGGPKEVEKYLKDKYIGQSKEVYEILNESFYINETTNHLVYYFNAKNFKYTMIRKNTINDYSVDKYFVNPETEEQKLVDTNFCLTVNILKFLDSLGSSVTDDDFKPTKFVTVACVRKDPEYCDQIFSTLDFASRIKST